LIRLLVTEGLLLSAASALLSIPVAWAGVRTIAALSAEPVFQQLVIDAHELTFVATLALICPLMFSLAPIRLLARPDMRQVLASGGRGTTTSMRGRSALVVTQVALAVILLMVSSLALRSMMRIYQSPIGIDSARLLVFGLEFNDVLYPEPASARAAADAARTALQKIAGVQGVELVTGLPVLGDRAPLTFVVDRTPAGPDDLRPTAFVTGASSGADRAMGLTLLSGQWWSEAETGVAVVSEAAARRHFGGISTAVGRTITISPGDSERRLRVIGVVSDVANTNRTQAAPARVWTPITGETRRFAYLVRGVDPGALADPVRRVVAAEAPAIPIEYLQTFDAALADAASSDYVVIGMLAGFAVLAVVLASTGLFGVVSYAVAQRTAEFGTRMALGASGSDVVRLVARESALLLAIGLSIGLAGGVGVASTMGTLLFGLSPADPATLAGVIALLSIVTIAATALPAWRASRIDPVVALRIE
jgi:putative ABC transport system permease protein